MDRKRDDFFIILGVAAIGFFWWLRKRKPSAFDSVTAKETATLAPNQPNVVQPGAATQSIASLRTNSSNTQTNILPIGVATKNGKLSPEFECRLEYAKMAKPKGVRNPEKEKRKFDNFMESCMVRKNEK